MNIKEIYLDGDVTLGVIDTKKFKFGFFSMNMIVEASKQSASDIALISRVLVRGSEKYPTIAEINKYCDSLYNLNFGFNSSVTGDNVCLKYTGSFLQDAYVPDGNTKVFAGLMSLLEELLFRPYLKNGAFFPEYVESEKIRLKDLILSAKNNKDMYAFRRCTEEMLGNINNLGYSEIIDKITPESLYQAFGRILDTAKIQAVFAGDFTPDTEKVLAESLEGMFSSRKTDVIFNPVKTADFVRQVDIKEITEEIGANQSRLVAGYTIGGGDEKYAAKAVFNEIFGGSPVSKLFMNVREKLHLCYYCSSMQIFYNGTMFVRSGISFDNLDKVLKEVDLQLEGMKDEKNITDDDLESAKKSLINNFVAFGDSVAPMGDWYLRRKISDLHTDLQLLIDQISATQKSDVSNIAKTVQPAIEYLLKGADKQGD